MKIKYFVGKDKTIDLKKEKLKRPALAFCKDCGDDLKPVGVYRGEGICVRCTMTAALYRDVDNARFREFQAKLAARPRA